MPPIDARRGLRHAAVIAAFAAFFCWAFARPLLDGLYLVQSDLYEQYLPAFLSPITTWSVYEFAGFAAFADPQDTVWYLPSLVLRSVHAWTALAISAYVLGAAFVYAYVFRLTRSHAAAAFSGLAFALSEAMIERLGHFATLHVFVWLPLVLLAIESILESRSTWWIVVGALALSQSFLAGHPQPALSAWYCAAAYAAVGGWREHGTRRVYSSVAVMFVLGLLLVSIKLVPVVEASALAAREPVGFGQFTSFSNSPAEMLSVLFSSIAHEGREAPTYVGLSVLALAIGATTLARRNWRIVFWAACAAIGLLLGAGDSTPLAEVAYWVPRYDRFRVVARHLYFFALGASILAGLALAWSGQDAAARRAVRHGVTAVLTAVAAGAVVLALVPEAFSFELLPALPSAAPIWNPGVWAQL